MSEALHLSKAEIAEATGAHRKSRQMAWFLSIGVPALLGADGEVRVLRAAYYAKMMPDGGKPRPKVKTEPRLDLLRKAS